jgi:hypothetical protein
MQKNNARRTGTASGNGKQCVTPFSLKSCLIPDFNFQSNSACYCRCFFSKCFRVQVIWRHVYESPGEFYAITGNMPTLDNLYGSL